MGKPTIVDYFRNITFVVFIFSTIAVIFGYDNGAILAVPYVFMEICAIMHRIFRFRTKQIERAGSERQMKYAGFFIPRHAIDMKYVAFFRRLFLVFSLGAIVKAIMGNDSLLWVIGLLVLLNLITFIKAWYIFRTKWEGSYSVLTLYKKQIAEDFKFPAKCINACKEKEKGAKGRLTISIIVILIVVCFVLFI